MKRLTFIVLLWISLFSSAVAGEKMATIIVDAARATGNVNPLIFGANFIGYQKSSWKTALPVYYDRGAGVWDPEKKIPVPGMVYLAKQAGVSIIRWPGGTAAKHFDWKKTIGPADSRTDQQFGLPEFLQTCAAIGATPIITLAEYDSSPQDAADLVEYLNSPDDGHHPWAAKRTADGHKGSWGVKWFEYGNETHFVPGPADYKPPEQYAAEYAAEREAMRNVDSGIQLGAVFSNQLPFIHTTDAEIMQATKGDVDFVIHHPYLPGYSGNDGKVSANTLFSIALASPEQFGDFFKQVNELTHQYSPSRTVPIALTEYNCGITQEKPVPYRLSLGNALLNAAFIGEFLRPDYNIVMANYWEFANEYWGEVRGYSFKNETIIKRPVYYVFEMYRDHFGSDLVSTKVDCDSYMTAGGFDVEPAVADGEGSMPSTSPEHALTSWQFDKVPGVVQGYAGDVLEIDFQSASDLNYYHAHTTWPARPGYGYRISAEIKTENFNSSRGACLEFGDSRGASIQETFKSTPPLTGTNAWTPVEADYIARPDARELIIRARRVSGGGAVSGKVYFRHISIQEIAFPATPYISVSASRTVDAATNPKKICLMIVNKNLVDPIQAVINVEGLTPRLATAWILDGPAVDATNEKDPNTVGITRQDLGAVKNGFVVELPPHSFTALAIER